MLEIKFAIKKKFVFGLIKTAKTVRREVWESWKDVPSSRRSELLNYCIQYPETAQLYALRDMLDIGSDFYILDLFAPLEFGQLLKKLDWLKIEDTSTPIISEFEFEGKKYALPKPSFENGTAIEYALIDRYFSEFIELQNDDSLLNLVATVARLVNKRGIPKSVRNTDEVEKKAMDLKGIGVEYIVNILSYVKAIRQEVFETYGEYLFKTPLSEEDKEYLEKRGHEVEEDEGDPLGWYSLFMLLAKEPANLGKIEQMNFHKLCIWRVKELQDAAKNKKNGNPEL